MRVRNGALRSAGAKMVMALGATLLVLGIAATGSRAQDKDQHAKAGAQLYHQYCGACHGISADGKGALYGMLDPKPANLTMIAAQNGGVFPDAKIAAIIDGRDPIASHGPREMPVWGKRFSQDVSRVPSTEKRVKGQVTLIVQFLRSIQK